MNNFKKDLEFGKIYEKKALEYLEYEKVEFIEGCFKEYDFIITNNNIEYKIEVKADRLGAKTGNLVIEYECSKKLSGISSTTANFWLYFIIYENKEECYKIPVDELKELIKSCRSVAGGFNYNAKMYLLNKSKVRQYLINGIKKNLYII
jgi:hypothetical protein